MKKHNGHIAIDKNVPLPPRRRGDEKYPWANMEVGDSFFSVSKFMPNIVYTRGRYDGRKYTARREGKGFRVWRVE